MALGVVAGGGQGLGYWTYFSGNFETVGNNPELWHAIGRINGELRPIAWLLADAQPPVSAGIVDAPPALIAESIRCSEDQATILALLNRNIVSDANGCIVEPVTNAVIHWTMPAGTTVHSVWRLSAEGPQPTDYTFTNGIVELEIPVTQEGDIYVAAHNPATAQRMLDIYNDIVEPLNQQANELYRSSTE